ncbi:MAG: transketolase, partial [Flavobacteriales bacterium]|nr:transketolase [Flavobacteriales bacterium]
EWSKEYDCIVKMRAFILEHHLAEADELDAIEQAAKKEVRQAQKAAWKEFQDEIDQDRSEVVEILKSFGEDNPKIQKIADTLSKAMDPIRKDVFTAARKALRLSRNDSGSPRENLVSWLKEHREENLARYSDFLYSRSDQSVENLEVIDPVFSDESEEVDGRIILRDNFSMLFEKYPEVLTFGEDTGKIGGVNQSMEGMQEKFGELRVSDTGIREATIVGQGIGMAMRGLRPIAEIQYLDYLYYAIQTLTDDLSTLHYRTKGGQKAPLIVRTRGHRLEGIWHSGSPMGAVIHSLRGMLVCVPRNMVTAAGFYNALLQSDDPALVVEPLNGYRTKEPKPQNLGEYTIPFGVPEIVREGTDITILSYGSTCNIAEAACKDLAELDIHAELIDARTLLPFDKEHMVAESLSKTNRLLIVDEDVPGGASAFMLDQVINKQKGYYHLDSQPITLTAKAHRPAYGSDGDYFSKPNIEDVVETAYDIMREAYPEKYPSIY